MDRTILYIINPISGRGNKKEIKEIIEEETKKTGLRFFVFPSVIDGDYSALFPMVQDEKITDVVIAGGDGTINQVVDAFKHLDVNFGIIPCGSGNGLAFSAGISKNIKKALHTIFAGTSKWTDSFLINDHFACMLCGVGFDAQVAHDFGKAPRRGLATYIQKTISNFIIAKTYPFTLITKQKEIVTNAFFISIANSNQFGNHFTIAPKASLTDGLLDVIILTKQNKLSVLLQVIKQISGYNKVKSIEMINENASLIYFQTNELKILNHLGAPVHIDGDPAETMMEIKIKTITNCFRLIYPSY